MAIPAEAPRKRLASPIEPAAAGSALMIWTTVGDPCLASSSALITETGRALSCGVPAM